MTKVLHLLHPEEDQLRQQQDWKRRSRNHILQLGGQVEVKTKKKMTPFRIVWNNYEIILLVKGEVGTREPSTTK